MALTDLTFLQGFTGGNPEKMKKFIGMFLSGAPALLNQIESLHDAKNYNELKTVIHTLKPQLSYMGVSSIESMVKEAEINAGHAENLDRLAEQVKMICETTREALKELEAHLSTIA